MHNLADYLISHWAEVLQLTAWHLLLVLVSGALAAAMAIPAGIWVTRPRRLRHAPTLLAIANVAQTVPSLAVIGLASALLSAVYLGVGRGPAVVALVLYSLLPILANTIAGLAAVDSAVMRAGRGMGMSPRQVLWQVELPLAAPVIWAGIRTALVINIGTAALAAAIGAPCLGTLIFQGISTGNLTLLLAGALPTALLAVLADVLLRRLERGLISVS